MVQVKRYFGRTTREALAVVKAELGPDAVVLSNRAVDGRVEIVALPSEEMGALNATVQQARQAAPAPAPVAAPTRPATASAALPKRTSDDDDSDFTVTLGQHIAGLAGEQKPSGLPARKRPEPSFSSGIEYRNSDEARGTQANILPFNPLPELPKGDPWPDRREEMSREAVSGELGFEACLCKAQPGLDFALTGRLVERLALERIFRQRRIERLQTMRHECDDWVIFAQGLVSGAYSCMTLVSPRLLVALTAYPAAVTAAWSGLK